MRTASVTVESASPYTAGRVFTSEKAAKESHDDFEKRVWAERLNVDDKGNGVIPGHAFMLSLCSAAKRYGGKIKGEGNSTWSKFFDSGILVLEPLLLGVTRTTVECHRQHVPSDGMPGGTKRVWRNFPIVHKWGGVIDYHVLDDKITEEKFEELIKQAFTFIGVGTWRPEKRGLNGRAHVKAVAWKDS